MDPDNRTDGRCGWAGIVYRYRLALLAVVFGAGLGLRVWGIDWGLPGRTELHPDEHDYVMKYALQVSWAQPDPGFLNYPSFLMYLIALVSGALRHLGILTADWQAYLAGRWIVALFGAATSVAVYRLLREINAGTAAALLAALWTALLPLNIWESHTATTDCVMTFWVIAALWAATRLLRVDRWRDFLLAGALVGLATGSKYPGALAAVAIPVAAIAGRHPWRRVLTGVALAGIAAFVAFFCVAPFSLLRADDLILAMQYENHHAHSHHIGFSLPLPGWQYHRFRYQLAAAWPFSMGIVLYAFAMIGTVWACWNMNRHKLPVLAFAIAFGWVVIRCPYVPLRYNLPLLVLGCCFAGMWQSAWLGESRRWRQRVALASLAACFIYTALFSIQTTSRWTRETRVEAGRWLDTALPKGGTMLMLGWHRYGGMPSDPKRAVVYASHLEKPIRCLEPTDPYDLIQITSLHFDRYYREWHPAMTPAYERLRDPNGPFTLVKRFESRFLNKAFYAKLDPMFGGYFVSPTLEFYRARNPRGPVPTEAQAVHNHAGLAPGHEGTR